MELFDRVGEEDWEGEGDCDGETEGFCVAFVINFIAIANSCWLRAPVFLWFACSQI